MQVETEMAMHGPTLPRLEIITNLRICRRRLVEKLGPVNFGRELLKRPASSRPGTCPGVPKAQTSDFTGVRQLLAEER